MCQSRKMTTRSASTFSKKTAKLLLCVRNFFATRLLAPVHFEGMRAMIRFAAMFMLGVAWLSLTKPAPAETPSPSDYVLITVILKHDQSKNLDELLAEMSERAFWANFPPEGIEVESWHVVMGVGHIVTLKTPPAHLRALNRAVEKYAWGPFRTEIHPSYDFKDIATQFRNEAGRSAR